MIPEACADIAFAPARRWRDPRDTRLLVIDPCTGRWSHGAISGLADELRAGDVLVLNDAATLPASLRGHLRGEAVEVRLAQRDDPNWRALVFGEGSWRTPTEARTVVPITLGDVIAIADDLRAEVIAIESPRLVTLRFDRGNDDALWAAIYAVGRPIQYSYIERDLPLWAVQNVYAGRPWALESPSAGRGLTWDLLLDLQRRGVVLARLTHAAGISSTGDAALDATLPWPERSDIPTATVAAITAAKASGHRVIAVGTSVVRALEGRARRDGRLIAGVGATDLILGPDDRLQLVDALLTGLHEPTASHFRLLQAFAGADLVRAAYADAARRGYVGHELGDANLIACSSTT